MSLTWFTFTVVKRAVQRAQRVCSDDTWAREGYDQMEAFLMGILVRLLILEQHSVR